MKASGFVKVAAAAGIAVGLCAVAAPSALAGVVVNHKGEQAVQEVGDFTLAHPLQAAQNDVDVDLETKIKDSVLVTPHHG